MKIKENLRYTPQHLWVAAAEDGMLAAGITDYAQDMLGDIVYVEPPAVGAHLVQAQPCGLVESVKTGSDLHAPMDGTVEIISAAGGAVDRWTSEPDAGIADAFNKGIALTTGEIIGLVNSDDILLPGAVAAVRSFFEQHPEVEVLHGDIELYDGEIFVKRIAPAARWWFPWRLVLVNHPATFVRRHVYDRHGGFDVSYRYAMDDDIFLRWIQRGVNIRYLPQALVRMQAGGASGVNAYAVFKEKRRTLRAHGYPWLPVEIQYRGRYVVQWIAVVQSFLRSFRRPS